MAAAEAAVFTSDVSQKFIGRVSTQSNPRVLGPVVTQQVLRDGKTVDFNCVGRAAASKLIHAISISNVKNLEVTRVFFKPKIAHGLKLDDGAGVRRGLTPFSITVFPGQAPRYLQETPHAVRRTKISAMEDHEELAKNIHLSYLRKTPVVLECMGEKAMGVITHSIALFNERVKAHEMTAYVNIITGKGPDGSELVKTEFQLVEEPKTSP